MSDPSRCKVNAAMKIETEQKCYIVMHSQGRHMDNEIKFIGVFSSRKLAKFAISHLKNKPGFDIVGKFSLDVYTLDRIQWSEGFVIL
jgi:hypothetical protein